MKHKLSTLLFVLLALALPSLALADEASPFGINIHAPAGAELDLLLDRAQAAGIGWVRIDFVWAYVEGTRDRYDWSLYDEIAAEARARGIEVFATLAYTPDWATSGPGFTGVPDDPAQWADFCFRAARRYSGSIRYWGLWNEANLDKFWSGSQQQYIDVIVKRGADAIRAGNPDALVGGPELAHLTSGDSDWYDWLFETLEQAGDKLDFITHHVYDEDGPGDMEPKLAGDTLFGGRPSFWDTVPPSVLEVLEEANATDKPFWLTETGWETANVSESRQAANYAGLLDDWFTGRAGRDWIDKVFFYEMKDGSAAGSPTWGILRPDGSAKPAYGAYRDFIASWAGAQGRTLALLGGRFTVEVSWRDHEGNTGFGRAVPDSDQSGFFWFFDAANLELVVKALDGRPVNNRWWIFYGALSDVEYWITVTDTQSGQVRRYHNPPGNLCGKGDTSAFPVPAGAGAAATSAADEAVIVVPFSDAAALLEEGEDPLAGVTAAAGACGGSSTALCLFGNRFRVEVQWRRRDGVTGVGTPVPRTDQSGTFWFFDPANLELVVKVLDGRPLTGRFWFFYGALSDVQYRINVTDTVTGASKVYDNPAGNLCGRGDTQAL
jgi:hypothetical protein